MKTRLLFAATMTLLGLGGSAWAQQPPQQQADRPCMADAARLCPDVEPGGGAQMACLKSHKEELSPACKRRVMQAKVKQMERQELQKQQGAPQP